MGYGFREVTVDQPFAGKWTDVDMNLGGHGTFQGTKFSDRAGGFSYKALPSPKQIMQNRFIYWRVLNDMLELTEVSMDSNLEDNQVRIIFRDSPIVSPVSIHETDESVIILVVTVSSVNRFVFTHPNKLYSDAGHMAKTKQPSIFQQAMAKPLMNFRNFSLFDHGINVPLPIAAASHVMPGGSGFIFALSYESGSVTVYKLDKEDRLTLYDLRQANIFTKILSFSPAYLTGRGSSSSHEAVIGLSFFIAKIEKNKKSLLFLVALTANGHIRLHICRNLKTLNEWSVFSDLVVDKRFANGYVDCNMILRRTYDNESAKEYPKFVVFVPGEGFKVFQTVRNDSTPPQLIFLNLDSIDFREKAVMDFSVTTEFLFILVSNPDEETEWQVKSYNLNDNLNPRFNLALLEPTPRPDLLLNSVHSEPKEFYFDLIFNKSSFSAPTIYNALSMFTSSSSFPKAENDWEGTKFYALRVLESEIRSLASGSDEPLADDDIYEMNMKHWLEFYNSCVEYHINTVKPLGIFYETNSRLVCVVKKSRISFLRPTDTLETMFYFPHCVPLPDEPEPDDVGSGERVALVKYLEIMDTIESTTDESHRQKIEKRIRENRGAHSCIWDEVANLLTEADPHSEVLERRHFIPMLTSKLRELGGLGEAAMRGAIKCLCSWEAEVDTDGLLPQNEPEEANLVMDDRGVVTENYMGGRLGANLTYGILKQLLNHRYMIARNTLILQSIVSKFFSQNNQNEGIEMVTSFTDQQRSQTTLLRAFTLLKMFERNAEFIHDSWVENGLKVAVLLNCSTADHLSHGKLSEFWPMRLLELFCHSSLGGMAIRSRVSQFTNSMVVAYADAAGRAIWPSDESVERPFEEFLVAACQFHALSLYASELETCPDTGTDKSILRKFYNGVADLFIRSPEDALSRFLSITPQQLVEAPYFTTKILDLELGSDLTTNVFYEKVIQLFQIFGFTSGVQEMADKGLRVSRQEGWRRIMSVLGFKSALGVGDYRAAYGFIARIPLSAPARDGGKERESSVRTFVTQILENGDIDVLLTLKTEEESGTTGTPLRAEIERVLSAQAKLSDPLSDDSVYQMLYFYHLGRHSYKKAAGAMLERIRKIGWKGHGRSALEVQRDSYLDILSCLSLLEEEEEAAEGGSSDPEDWLNMLRNARITSATQAPQGMEVEEDAGGEEAGSEDPTWIAFLQQTGLLPQPQPPPTPKDESEDEGRLSSYHLILREAELCISLLLIPDDRDVEPIQLNDERRRAETGILNLTLVHEYDQAVKLAGMWALSYVPIIQAFTKTCINLVYQVLPASGDLADYVRHLDTSELPNWNYSVPDMAFHSLHHYIRKLEKPRESCLHKEATLVLLSYSMTLPRWLQDSYKRRDVAELIRCYTRFGEWEEATSLCLDVLDAALGRREATEFDPSIQTVSPYLPQPLIPYTAMEDLGNQMNARLQENPKLEQLVVSLRERCEDFVIRVIETRQELELMHMNGASG